jgi:heme oxygenase
MSSLFERLKSSTEQEHNDIEAIIDPLKNFCSLPAYQAHLVKTWILYQSLEAELAAVDWSAIGIDFEARRKTPLLEEDLRFLHVAPVSHASVDSYAPQPDPAFALGCLYVLEGATLGGQFISRHLAKLGIGPANGGLFFNSYGAKTGEMWKAFQTSASRYCTTEGQIERAVKGAKATFGRFRDSMLKTEPTPTPAYGS